MFDRRRLGLAVAAAVAGATLVVAVVSAASTGPIVITIKDSHYNPSAITVPLGRPVTIVIRNEDPIDHEWIIGDAAVHERHRLGTEPWHASRPTEVSIPALETRETTITFTTEGQLQYICHLPGHEAYGMVGVATIVR